MYIYIWRESCLKYLQKLYKHSAFKQSNFHIEKSKTRTTQYMIKINVQQNPQSVFTIRIKYKAEVI